MPFQAFPSGHSRYLDAAPRLDPATRRELPSPSGVFRLVALVATIAGSSVAMAADSSTALMAHNG